MMEKPPIPVLGQLTRGWGLGVFSELFPTAVRIVVLDTNVLLMALRRYLRDGGRSLLDAADRGSTRLFAADHVRAEVREKVRSGEVRMSVPPATAVQIFDREFARRIRWVDVSTVRTDDERVHRVGDIDDIPTALLTTLLAPAIALSRDPDLVDVDLARSDWVPAIAAGAARGLQLQAAFLGVNGLAFTASVATNALDRRIVGSPSRLIGAGIGMLALGAVARRLVGRGAIGRGLAQLGDAFVTGLEALLRDISETSARLDAATVSTQGVPSLEQRVARALALEFRPLSHVEIASLHSLQAVGVTRRQVLAALRSRPEFVPIGRWGWQLGTHDSIWKLLTANETTRSGLATGSGERRS